MDLECFMLSRTSHSEKDKYHTISFVCEKKKKERDGNKLPKQPHRQENRLMEPTDEIRVGE